jgi:hypothetical protein
MISQLLQRVEEVIAEIDSWIDVCTSQSLPCDRLLVVSELLTGQVVALRESLAYKIEQYDNFGIFLDEEDADELRSLVAEIGFDIVHDLFGDSALSVLQNGGEVV